MSVWWWLVLVCASCTHFERRNWLYNQSRKCVSVSHTDLYTLDEIELIYQVNSFAGYWSSNTTTRMVVNCIWYVRPETWPFLNCIFIFTPPNLDFPDQSDRTWMHCATAQAIFVLFDCEFKTQFWYFSSGRNFMRFCLKCLRRRPIYITIYMKPVQYMHCKQN